MPGSPPASQVLRRVVGGGSREHARHIKSVDRTRALLCQPAFRVAASVVKTPGYGVHVVFLGLHGVT